MCINLPWGSNTDVPEGSPLYGIVHWNSDTDIHLHSKCSQMKTDGEIRDMVCHSLLCLMTYAQFYDVMKYGV
jgi:hypothetical protein